MAGPVKQIGWTHTGSQWAQRVLGTWDSAGVMIYESGIVTHIESMESVEKMKALGVPDLGRVDDWVLETYTFAKEVT